MPAQDLTTNTTNNSKEHNVNTLSQLIDRHGVQVDGHLAREMTVPAIGGLQCQGDVAVIPATKPAITPVPAQGVPVVRGEAGGNTHLLLADGDVYCDVATPSRESLLLARVTVAAGAVGYLAHPEHGYSGIAPGSYELRRQREQADQVRLVAD